MHTNNGSIHPMGSVIDLVPITAACRSLVSWYDRQIAGGEPDVTELEQAMAAMRELPEIPGRVGRDIDLIISGGSGLSPGDSVAAIERLRLVASHNPQHSTPTSTGARDRQPRRPRKKRAKNKQAPLPGLGNESTEETSWRSS